MQHPTLGNLQEDEGAVIGYLLLNGASISLRVDPDEVSIDQALSLATTIATSLSEYDRISKDVIVRDLLETYNSNWSSYDETQEDGSIKTVANPELSPDEFKSKLTLYSVSIRGDSCVDLSYENDDLFWGHNISVSSSEGADFANSEAELFG
ncbi:MAG: DUF2262 domain-containing protein [Rhodanobacter sp.]|jgi:hypothetical protein|nr:DUF2262 domain-containing protein [Rhodanobacter sp.]